jgi:hypothetical protein
VSALWDLGASARTDSWVSSIKFVSVLAIVLPASRGAHGAEIYENGMGTSVAEHNIFLGAQWVWLIRFYAGHILRTRARKSTDVNVPIACITPVSGI